MADTGVGQQMSEYAQQFNDLSALDDNPVAMQRKADAKARAQALTEKAEKAGVKAPSLTSKVSEVKAAEKPSTEENPYAALSAPAETSSGDNPYAALSVPAETKKLTPMVSRTGETSAVGSLIHGVKDAFSGPSVVQQEKERLARGEEARDKGASPLEVHKAEGASPVAEGLAMSVPEIAAPVGKAVTSAAKAPINKAADITSTIVGTPVKQATADLRTGALGKVGEAISADEKAAAKAKAAGAEITAKQPAVAEQRAITAAKEPPPGQVAGAETKAVKTVLDERVNALTKQAEAAGVKTENAKKAAEEHVGRAADAEKAVDTIAAETTSKPGMSKEDFGKSIYKTAADLKTKYSDIRKKESGYAKALEDAGDAPIVDTTGPIQVLKDRVKMTKGDAPMGAVLKEIEQRLTSTQPGGEGDVAAQKVSASVADSTRKFIADILRAKKLGETAIDQETAVTLSMVSDALKQPLYEASPALREASAKWAELSKPLDILRKEGGKKGGLKGVLSADPASVDAAMEMADITGHVIKKANAGNKVFDRLLSESPDLRESARLYFSRDLLGNGKVPSDAALKDWLTKNEGSLKQLGLYDEFSNVARATRTAERAADEAGSMVKQTAAEAKKAAQEETGVRKDLDKQNKLRAKLTGDMKKTADEKPTVEGRTAESGKRAEEAKGRLQSEQKAKESSALTYKNFEAELATLPDKAVPGKLRTALDKLHLDKRIDDQMYKESLESVQKLEKLGEKRDLYRKRARNILFAATLAIGGYPFFRDVRAFLGL